MVLKTFAIREIPIDFARLFGWNTTKETKKIALTRIIGISTLKGFFTFLNFWSLHTILVFLWSFKNKNKTFIGFINYKLINKVNFKNDLSNNWTTKKYYNESEWWKRKPNSITQTVNKNWFILFNYYFDSI